MTVTVDSDAEPDDDGDDAKARCKARRRRRERLAASTSAQHVLHRMREVSATSSRKTSKPEHFDAPAPS